jgi:glycosyltransferase involved in cell wall biosynthesis
MTRLRVLELIKCLDVGGSEVLLLERLRQADHERFDYSVGWLDPGRAMLVPQFEELGLPVRCFGAASVADWRWLRTLRRQLRARPVDVVHVHSPLMAAGVRAVVRSIGKARPALVTTVHGVGHRLTGLAGVATVRADDLVIAVSDAIRDSPICRTARDVQTLHHGINVDRLGRLRAQREHLAGVFGLADGPRVVSVANFRPVKAYPVMLQAARLVHAQAPSVHFYVAGQGPLEDWVRNEVRGNHMEGYFHVLGRIPDAARLSACADIFALCSSYEGLPVALMEALACGVPAVATAVGGMPELIQSDHNGRLVPPNDPLATATAILHLLGDAALRERLSQAAVATAHRHDIARTAEVIEGHYVRLAAARKSRSLVTAART